MDDLVINVRQILQYPKRGLIAPTDALLLQATYGGPYYSASAAELVSSALSSGGWQLFKVGFGPAWTDTATLIFDGSLFQFSDPVAVPSLNTVGGHLYDNGFPLATQNDFEWLKANSLISFNGRVGAIQLEEVDILRAGAAPVNNPHFSGTVTAPTLWDVRRADDTVATTQWVQNVLCAWYNAAALTSLVTSFNGRHGDIVLSADDISSALLSAIPPDYGQTLTPPFGDVSQRIANTSFVQAAVDDLQDWVRDHVQAQQPDLSAYAPLNSPQLTGVPTAPTAAPGSASGQIATTAFVLNAVAASTAGVASFNGRTGAVVLAAGDVTGAGGALLASPTFTGVPAAPTASPGANTTQLATTAFVHAAIAAISAGVSSFNTRTGAVTLTTADVTSAGGAPIASPAFTGTPTSTTPAGADNSTRIATTAFVQGLIASVAAGVTSFNGRTGVVSFQASDLSAVGGALLANPAFTGVPTAPTATAGTSTTQIATTAFVAAAISAGNVVSFNGRTGAITLSLADITGAGGAPISSPAFTGTATSGTVSTTVNDNTIATTAFVHNLVAAGAGVASFNTRTGAVTLQAADVTGVGGALLASPAFTGTPTAATAAPGTNTTQLATTQFVTAAVAASVLSFNGRTGAVTFQASDLSAVGGAPLASPAFTGTPTAPTAVAGTNTTQLATTAFVQAAITAGGGVLSFNGRAGTVTLQASDVTGVGGALLASPTFTGTPAAPTPVSTDNSTTLATTAFVTTKVNASVVSFNTRTGAVVLSAADVTGVGGALLASPTFTGVPAAPTATAGTNTTQLATTAFVQAAIAGGPFAPIASPTFTGTPAGPTAALNTNTTQLATTAFVLGQAAIAAPLMDGTAAVGTGTTWARADHIHPTDTSRAPLASPAFTGTPTAPTPATADNSTAIATTAYVKAQATGSAVDEPFAYWGGQITFTPTSAVTAINASTGVITTGAHGLTINQPYFGPMTGTAPSGLVANAPYYIRPLSTTTYAMYLTAADARADTNRITGMGTGTLGWNVRVASYSQVISKNFDANVPIGSQGATVNMKIELNLSAALPQTVGILTLAGGGIGPWADNEATPAIWGGWIQINPPAIINSQLIRFDNTTNGQNWVTWAGSPIARYNIGSWTSQGATGFYFGIAVFA